MIKKSQNNKKETDNKKDSNAFVNGMRRRPEINKNQWLDDVDIPFRRVVELEEDKEYNGNISDCRYRKNDKGETLALTIKVDDGDEFTTYHNCPLPQWSVLNYLLDEFQTYLGRVPQPKDLIGNDVKVTIRYNEGKDGREFINIKTLFLILNGKDEEADEFDEDEDSDDDKEDLMKFFDGEDDDFTPVPSKSKSVKPLKSSKPSVRH